MKEINNQSGYFPCPSASDSKKRKIHFQKVFFVAFYLPARLQSWVWPVKLSISQMSTLHIRAVLLSRYSGYRASCDYMKYYLQNIVYCPVVRVSISTKHTHISWLCIILCVQQLAILHISNPLFVYVIIFPLYFEK